MQEHKNNNPNLSENPNPPPPPPPPHNRRPRVREVSSRFMTPKVSSVNRRRDDSSDDENSESSFPITSSFIPHKKQQNQRAIKLFKETTNEVFESNPHPSKSCSSTPRASRPDTPIPTGSVSSRYRFTPHHQNHQFNHHRSIDAPPSAAKKLLQFSGAPKTNDDSGISCSTQSLPELCCENDRETNVSIGSVAEKIGNSLLSRSVSLSSSVAKQCGSGSGNLHLPPVAPQFAKSGVGARRGKKVSSHQEDVHSLRLLYNRYMQWRFCNARAAFSMKAQQKECEKALYSVATKISEMRESTIRKRIELELLRRSKTLSTVLEAQIPYLDEWSAMEEDYSVSITEAIQALLNASAQLPTVGNVRVDVRELGESLNSALKMMETIVSNTQRLMPKAEETDTSISELARVVGGERALIGECGDLLSKTYDSQVEECSLRGQLIQLHLICHKNKKNKE